MKSSVTILFSLLTVFASIAGCGAGLKGISNSPDCRTTIEGALYSQQKWHGNGPMIVMQQMGDVKIWKGTIIERRDDGVVFDRDRVGVLVDPEPKFYKYDDITALIDESGTLVQGSLPESLAPNWGLEFTLKSLNDSRMAPLKMKMMPGETFGYCIPAGRYEVTGICFISGRGDRVVATSYPDIQFQMREGAANYIGDIYLDYPPMENATVTTIECPPDGKSEEDTDRTSVHTLQHVYRDDFKYRGSGYLKRSGIEITG